MMTIVNWPMKLKRSTSACWNVSWLSPHYWWCSFVSGWHRSERITDYDISIPSDDEDCAECEEILEELEEIDGEADMFGIDFVKIASPEAAKTYDVVNIPSLVYFR